MKKLTLIAVLTLTTQAQALTCGVETETQKSVTKQEVTKPTPEYLKGATITVTLANGSTVKMSADSYMVVPRKQVKESVSTKIVQKPIACLQEDKTSKNNILSLQAVRSQNGLDRNSPNMSTTEVETKNSVGVGLLYQRKLDTLVLGVGGDTNKGLNLGLGLEF